MKQLHLLYHRVNCLHPDPWTLCVSPNHFAEHLEVVSRLSMRPIITFDDGYADNLTQALPLLEKYDVAGRFFIVSGSLGSATEMWWDDLERLFLPHDESSYYKAFDSLRPLPFELQEEQLDRMFDTRHLSRAARPDRRMLTVSELVKLAASPLAEIGAHTVTHPVLSSLDRQTQCFEISASKAQLESIVNATIQGFSYPNGMHCDYNAISRELVRQAGFTYSYSAFEHTLSDCLQVSRVMIRDCDGDEFMRVLHNAATHA